MKALRKLLVGTLGFERYIRFVSRMYLRLVAVGWGKAKYPELFYLARLVKPGDVCLDIGANLGYYSVALSRLVGPTGKVLAVEPVPLFQRIWQDNVRLSGINNLLLLPYALGGQNTSVRMGTPARNGLLHHGMTKIADSNPAEQYGQFYDVDMRVPDELLADFDRLDFVKCDVEGFEHQVFQHMQATLRRHRPVIQTELNGGDNRRQVSELLAGLGYRPYVLETSGAEPRLVPCGPAELQTTADRDFYFKPDEAAHG
ncbi:FkbM family methyltransferase [Hymenobacter busanensis]|uniref:FkbM family methyltransferase n=1 Tax=Hymenobacter busanensis TaxID=2607656 RepID=A0A7L5A3V6_9BACT|nr:FkbM family methyltransferase [Hymenobacter busanensis]KAA9331506.1 FkbM family methyltransferase [Hymenobacter busanensis]QHJ08660.1 FkbM family methyltransferase [Hymenobacter busanensis]